MAGWIRKVHANCIEGWDAVSSEIEDDGTVHNICIGTMCTEDVNYYMNRPFFDNDTHGSFAVIFAGIEAQRMMDEDTK